MFFMDLRHFSFRKLVILWITKPSPQQSLFLLKDEIRIVLILRVEVIPCFSMRAAMMNVGGASYAPNIWGCRDCDCTNLNLNVRDQAAILLPLPSALRVSAPLTLALTPCASVVYGERTRQIRNPEVARRCVGGVLACMSLRNWKAIRRGKYVLRGIRRFPFNHWVLGTDWNTWVSGGQNIRERPRHRRVGPDPTLCWGSAGRCR
jgi:hypothetical protein